MVFLESALAEELRIWILHSNKVARSVVPEQSIFNPFLADKPAHEYFVGREEELKELRRYLDQACGGKPSNLYIVGGGGDGKTSFLLKAVEEAEQQGLLAVFLNIDVKMTQLKLVSMLIESILEKLAKKSGEEEHLRDFRRKDGNPSRFFRLPNGSDVITKYLKDDFETVLQLCKQNSIPAVVFCFDEGQNLRIINGQLLAHLRGAIQELGEGFMIVLSSLEDIMPEVSEKYVGVDRFFPNRLTLGPFGNDNEARLCIKRRLEGLPIAFSPLAIDLIVRISGRHPREIIRISHSVFNDAIDSNVTVVNDDMVDAVIRTKFRDKVIWLEEQLGKLIPDEQDTLRELVVAGGKATVRKIATNICDTGNEKLIRRMISALTADFAGLCECGICRRIGEPGKLDAEEQYEIIDPMSVYILEGLLEVRRS